MRSDGLVCHVCIIDGLVRIMSNEQFMLTAVCPRSIKEQAQIRRSGQTHLHQRAHLDSPPHRRTGPLVELVHRAELDDRLGHRFLLSHSTDIGIICPDQLPLLYWATIAIASMRNLPALLSNLGFLTICRPKKSVATTSFGAAAAGAPAPLLHNDQLVHTSRSARNRQQREDIPGPVHPLDALRARLGSFRSARTPSAGYFSVNLQYIS